MGLSERAQKFLYSFLQVGCQMGGALFYSMRAFGRWNVPAKGGALLMVNHQSMLDPMLAALALPRPVHFMARDTLFKLRPFAWLIRSLNAFPVHRHTADLGAVKEAIRRLRSGAILLIFPEGTRTPDGQIGKIEPGVIMLARRAKVPTIPVVIDGAFEAWPRHLRFPRLGTVRVMYGEAIPPEALKGMAPRDYVKRLRNQMVEMQHTLRRRYQRPLFE